MADKPDEGKVPESKQSKMDDKVVGAGAAAQVNRALATDTEANRRAVAEDPEYQASLRTLNEHAASVQGEEARIDIDPHGNTKDRADVKTAVATAGLPYNEDPEGHGLPGPITGHAVHTDGSEEVVVDTRLKFWRPVAGEGDWIDVKDTEAIGEAKQTMREGSNEDTTTKDKTRDKKGQNVRRD